MAREIPEKTIVNHFSDGGIQVIPGRDQPSILLQGQVFHRWPDGDGKTYVSVPDESGDYVTLQPKNGGSEQIIRNRYGQIVEIIFVK